MCNLHKLWQCSQMCVRNNICWRIRGSDLSLLPWSCGLCIFVEQLCLVASRRFSRHLKGRSVVTYPCPAPPLLSPLPSVSSVSPLLPSASCWVSMGSRPNKQTNRTTEKPITQTRLVWAWGREMGERDLVYFLGQFHFTVMAEKASQDTAIHTSVWLPAGIKVVLSPHWHIIFWPNTQLAASTGRWPLPKLILFSTAVGLAFLWGTWWCGIQLVAYSSSQCCMSDMTSK